MSKFEFKVTKIHEGGKIWEHFIIIQADEKLNAFAKLEEIFPSSDYFHEFIRIC